MLNHPTLEKLRSLKLLAMARGIEEQMSSREYDALSFAERVGLIVDREMTERESRRLESRMKKARLGQTASLEDVDYRARRGLDKGLLQSLQTCQWVKEHLNVLITGPTGVGKSYLGCALAQKACREGYRVLYARLPRLLGDLAIGKADGRYATQLASLSRADVLVLDDWGLGLLAEGQRRDLLEILEDRYQRGSTVVTSQLPIAKWHEMIGDPTLADAILDRLVHNAYRIELKGDSMRKQRAPKFE